MQKKSNHKSASAFFSFLNLLFLIAACVLFSAVLVWPLWKFSTSLPKVYTVLILVLLGAVILYFSIKKIIKSNKISVIKFFSNLIVILLALVFSFLLIISGQRIPGILVFTAGIAVEIVINIIFSKIRHE